MFIQGPVARNDYAYFSSPLPSPLLYPGWNANPSQVILQHFVFLPSNKSERPDQGSDPYPSIQSPSGNPKQSGQHFLNLLNISNLCIYRVTEDLGDPNSSLMGLHDSCSQVGEFLRNRSTYRTFSNQGVFSSRYGLILSVET